MVKVETHTFPNGLRIVYEKSKSKLPITTIFLFCDLGSLYEKENFRGVSHFIEHMCFKGTQRILKTRDIFKEFDKSGSVFNASTFKQYTYYYIECLSEDLMIYFQILSDILLNSTFIQKEYDKELKVVIEENVKNEDNKEYILSDAIDSLIYKGCPLENPIDTLAFHKTQGSYDRQKVLDLYELFYQPSNMVVSMVSNLSLSTLLYKIKHTYFYSRKSFHVDALSREKLVIYQPPAVQTNIAYNIKEIPHTKATYLSIAFRTCSQHSLDKYVLNLLEYIIGGFYNSRLFMLLREDNGLTYKTRVNNQYFEVMGDLTLMAITDPKKLIKNHEKKGVLPLIIGLLKELIEKGVRKEELAMAKTFIKGRMILNMSDQETNAVYNGEEVLLYKKKRYHFLIRKYMKPIINT